jgi:hypothetical protein
MKTIVKIVTITALMSTALPAHALFNNVARAFATHTQFARTFATRFARHAVGTAAFASMSAQETESFEEQVKKHEKEIRAECAKEIATLQYPLTAVFKGDLKVFIKCQKHEQYCKDSIKRLHNMSFLGFRHGQDFLTINNTVNADDTRADIHVNFKMTVSDIEKPETAAAIEAQTMFIALKRFNREFKKCIKEFPLSAINPRCNALFNLISETPLSDIKDDGHGAIESFDYSIDIQ